MPGAPTGHTVPGESSVAGLLREREPSWAPGGAGEAGLPWPLRQCSPDPPPSPEDLRVLQKYWGFSTKLLLSPSSLASTEEWGLLLTSMNCRDMAKSSS